MNYTKQTFRIFYQHLAKYKLVGLILIFSIIIGAIISIIPPLFYKDFFNVLTGVGVIAEKVGALINILIKVLILYLIEWFFLRLANFFLSYLETRVMTDLSNTCFSYLHKHSVSFFNNNFVGSLVKRVNRFSRAFEGITDTFIWEFLPVVVDIILIVVILAWHNLTLGLLIFIWVAIYCLINYYFSLYKLKYDIKRSEIDSKVTGFLADTITNHLNLRLFSGYEREKSAFNKINIELQKLRFFTWNLSNVFEAVQVLLMIFLELGIFYYAIKLWQKGLATIGDFVLIQAYLMTIFHQLWNFGRVIRRYYENLADAEEMTEILETPHEIKDVKNAKELIVSRGEIEFNKVSFSYHQTRRVITDLNVIFRAKERVALVGPSGSGKSTIINLLLRNYDLEKGKILIDGQKISAVTQESLWKNASLVPQEPILFHRTLKENIRYGQPEATDEEIVEAAKLAHCYDFISQFPETYETYVGERGVKLSGGERQRIAIARAILKNAPILILDEATSSLDSESEQLIQSALGNLMKDKTVIVIAHRLSTIMKMDRIIVLNEGRIVEEGTHQQLLHKKDGLYKQLWERQVGGFIK